MKKIFFLVPLFVFIAVPLQSAQKSPEKMRLAVLDFEAKQVSKAIAVMVSDLLRTEMVDTGQFTVVERGQMSKILAEHEFQQTGCTDSACAVQMGKLLSAKKMLIGEVNKLGAGIIISARVVDVERGSAEFASSEKARDMNDIERAAKSLSVKLAERITGKRVVHFGEEPKTGSGYFLRGTVPGWGQFYARRPVWGTIYMTTFAASAGYLVYSVLGYKSAKSDYDGLGINATTDDFTSKRKDYKDSAKNVNIALGILGAVYILNWLDLFIFKPDFGGAPIASAADRYFMNISLNPYYNDRNSFENIYSVSCGMRF